MKFSFVIDVSKQKILKISAFVHRFKDSVDECQRVSLNLMLREPSADSRNPYLNFDFREEGDALEFLKDLRDHLDQTIDMLEGT